MRLPTHIAATLAGALLAACTDTVVDPTLPAALRLDALPDTMGLGDTVTVVPRVIDGDGRVLGGRDVVVTSLTPAAVDVDATSGRLVARAVCSATIRARGAGLQLDRVVVVARLVRDIAIAIPRDSVVVGERFAVDPVPRDGMGQPFGAPIRFTSTDTLVLRVDSVSGAAQVVGDGEAAIVVASGGIARARTVRAWHRQVRAPNPADVVRALGLGDGFVCVIAGGARQLACEGDNAFGALGRGTVSAGTLPMGTTSLAVSATQLRVRGRTACAVDVSARGWCWGENLPGSTGPTGTPTQVVAPPPTAYALVDIGLGPQGVGCATWALDGGGYSAPWCWGRSTQGLLGDRDATAADTVFGSANAIAIASPAIGTGHACATGPAVGAGSPSQQARVYCWGDEMQNFTAADTGTVRRPTLVPDAIGSLRDVVVTRFGTCARDDIRAVLVCWGRDGGWGELPGATPGPSPGVPGPYMPPTVVAGVSGILEVAASSTTLCVRTAAADAWCWGRAARGAAPDAGTRAGGRVLLTRRQRPAAIAVGDDRVCFAAYQSGNLVDATWWCPR